MPYFNDINTYLHQSSLLIQAYPTTRVTTKYSLPKKPKPGKESTTVSATGTDSTTPKREPAATLTLKTFHPDSGICLKYKTDKAQEIGRLMTGVGKLGKGEIIEMPSVGMKSGAAPEMDKMDVDEGMGAPKLEDKVATTAPAAAQTAGGSKNKKKKGKK